MIARDLRRAAEATIRPLRPSPIRIDATHVLASEPLDPFWRIRPPVDPAAAPPPRPVLDPWDVLPESVRILTLPDGTRSARVDERVWMTGGPFLPELVVQRLHAHPRSDPTQTHHDDLRGCTEETRAWALEQAAAAGLDPVAWRLTVEIVERWSVDAREFEALPLAPNAKPDPDPVFEALAVAADEQTFLNRAECRRVLAAVAAWRLAQSMEGPGAANTPYLNGFFQDLGLTLGIAGPTARNLVYAADRIERSLPLVWQRFLDATCPWRAMQAVSSALDGLDQGVLPPFDAQAVIVLDETPVTLLKDALRRLAERLQATTADDRHDAAMRRRAVTIEAGADGMGWLHANLPMAALLAIDHQLTKAAIRERQRSEDAGGIGVLRADVFQDGLIDALAKDADPDRPDVLVPNRRGIRPTVGVLIPAMTALGHSDVPATLQGYGPIGIRTALRLAGEAKSWIRVLTDPFTGAVVNIGRTKYRPTADMRALLRLLDGGGRGPGCTRGPTDTEVDHNRSFSLHDEFGDTAIDNLMLLSHFDHGQKTAGETEVGLLKDRTAIFTTAAGNRYVTRPHDPPEPTPVPPGLIDRVDDRYRDDLLEDCPF